MEPHESSKPAKSATVAEDSAGTRIVIHPRFKELASGSPGHRLTHGIRVVFSTRNPDCSMVTDGLLVLSYALDGNAFRGPY